MTEAEREAKRRYRERHREELRAKSREYQRQRRAEDAGYLERQREYSRQRRREKPEEIAAARREWYERNHSHALAYSRKHYAENREAALAQAAAHYRESHPDARPYWPLGGTPESELQRRQSRRTDQQAERRARKSTPLAENIDRLAVFQRDGGKCHLCGRKCDPKRFHLDHLVPLSKGGEHRYDNVAVAHPSCNIARGPGRVAAQLLLIGGAK